ncbi:MAG: hypothetical protein E7463_06330 [Ruminococcaceae bacterium]|nr:hypothetical protein [Oscillospiraceae bacterium]
MKAVILAGGEGNRLRPLTCETPKPMTRLLDRPILEYVLAALRTAGIHEAVLTLGYRPQEIEAYIGDGSAFEMKLICRREQSPRGTAGSVADCADLLGDEDFLVISGDCVCDLDLRRAIDFHRQHDADATIVLTGHSAPTEYGLVLADADGRVRGFVEKPSWGQVVTDRVSTGIYVLSPRVFSNIPQDKPCDFARDVFPLLLETGSLYAVTPEGYWCDVGDCDAFLGCAFDILDAKPDWASLGLERADVRAGSASFPGVTIHDPCYVGENVRLMPGAVIGPYAVIGEGSVIASTAQVRHSIVQGAVVGEGADIHGSILCPDVHIGRRCTLEEASVLGRGVRLGEDCTVRCGVRIWPDAIIAPGQQVTESLHQASRPALLRFDEQGRLQAAVNDQFTVAEACLLGSAAAGMAVRGCIALGTDGSPEAEAMAAACEAGILTRGTQVARHDAPIASAAAWLAESLHASLGIFFSRAPGQTLGITVTDSLGLPLAVSKRRELEGTLRRRDTISVPEGFFGRRESMTGTVGLYAGAAVGAYAALPCLPGDFHIWVPGEGEASSLLLREILGRMGADVEPGAFLIWEPSADGMSLAAVDENGVFRDDAQTLGAALLEACTLRRTLYLPGPVSPRLQKLLMERGCELRQAVTPRERREAARERYLWDGVMRAAFLSRRIAEKKTTLVALCAALPQFAAYSREVPVKGSRAALMRRLGESMAAETGLLFPGSDGLRLERPGGSVRVQPSAQARALRITAEAESIELASELCDLMEARTLRLDG